MWPVEMFLWAKVVVDGNCTGMFAFLGSLYLLSSLVVRLDTTVALICGVLHSTGECKGMWKRNRETLMKPCAEPWHPETLPLDRNPAVDLRPRLGGREGCQGGLEPHRTVGRGWKGWILNHG